MALSFRNRRFESMKYVVPPEVLEAMELAIEGIREDAEGYTPNPEWEKLKNSPRRW